MCATMVARSTCAAQHSTSPSSMPTSPRPTQPAPPQRPAARLLHECRAPAEPACVARGTQHAPQPGRSRAPPRAAQSAAAAQPDPNDAATLEDLRKRYSDYRASVATRLSSQATTLEDLRARHEEWGRRLGAPQTSAPNAITRLDGAFAADATPRTAPEGDRLQQQDAMAQRESQLLLQLLHLLCDGIGWL